MVRVNKAVNIKSVTNPFACHLSLSGASMSFSALVKLKSVVVSAHATMYEQRQLSAVLEIMLLYLFQLYIDLTFGMKIEIG